MLLIGVKFLVNEVKKEETRTCYSRFHSSIESHVQGIQSITKTLHMIIVSSQVLLRLFRRISNYRMISFKFSYLSEDR